MGNPPFLEGYYISWMSVEHQRHHQFFFSWEASLFHHLTSPDLPFTCRGSKEQSFLFRGEFQVDFFQYNSRASPEDTHIFPQSLLWCIPQAALAMRPAAATGGCCYPLGILWKRFLNHEWSLVQFSES